jgi:MFS family permease
MALNLVNQVGEWNPQLFREIKGRLKPRNILIAVTLSLLGQLLLLMSFSAQLPVADERAVKGEISNRYCTGNQPYPSATPKCLPDGLGGVEINWQAWWQDVFIALSIAGVVALIIVGTYMLISDISKEEQRGTLNFLRLAPQSSQSILIGKMLGVPILLYLIGFLAFPLHLAAGLLGEISFGLMLGWYALVGAACLFFYSAALLFGLTTTWLGSFQAWLGGGAILMFVWIMTMAVGIGGSNTATQTPLDWIILFNPSAWLAYLTGTNSLNASPGYQTTGWTELLVWGLPVGKSALSMLGVMLLNYAIWTYWAWASLKRCFHNPKATLFSKQQSYWFTACFVMALLGLAVTPKFSDLPSYNRAIFQNFQMLMVFNLLLFLGYIAALSPQRQAMQDWARYRHQNRSRKSGVMADLMWGEKSPAVVAIALNLAIASSMLFTWILFWNNSASKLAAVFALLVNISLILLYATVAQLILQIKSQKRAGLAAGAVGLLILVPQLMIMIHFLPQGNGNYLSSDLWLFSAFPWVAIQDTSAISVFLAVIAQSLATGLLSLQLTKKLRKAGESSTKALLSGRSPVAID